MMLKHHRLLYQFMSRMSRSHNNEQASLQKLIPSSFYQTRTKKLYVNSPIPKLSSQEVASLVRSKRELTYASITGGTEERTGGLQVRTGGTEEITGDTIERTGGTKDNNKQWNSPIPKLSSKKVASLVRARRDLSRLSRRSSGTEEGSGGTVERTGGTEERTGGTEERTGGTEDSYKQWRKMG